MTTEPNFFTEVQSKYMYVYLLGSMENPLKFTCIYREKESYSRSIIITINVYEIN